VIYSLETAEGTRRREELARQLKEWALGDLIAAHCLRSNADGVSIAFFTALYWLS
jgi:hypothetical protein